jgi:hypothetical protein
MGNRRGIAQRCVAQLRTLMKKSTNQLQKSAAMQLQTGFYFRIHWLVRYFRRAPATPWWYQDNDSFKPLFVMDPEGSVTFCPILSSRFQFRFRSRNWSLTFKFSKKYGTVPVIHDTANNFSLIKYLPMAVPVLVCFKQPLTSTGTVFQIF